jgi:hypothetical protein
VVHLTRFKGEGQAKIVAIIKPQSEQFAFYKVNISKNGIGYIAQA